MSFRSLVLTLVLVSVPTVALAQENASVPPQHPHVGLFGGFGLHAGNLSCEGNNCNEFRKAGGFDGHLGWGLNAKLGLVGDFYLMTSSEDNLDITQSIFTVGVRWWIVPILWVQAGVGGASASYHYDGPLGLQLEGHTDNVAAFAGAVGFEVLKGRKFALDIEGRFG